MTIFESTDIAAIRNVALVGASATGKTTLTEALLLRAGALKTAGSVERGSTVSDHDPLEKRVPPRKELKGVLGNQEMRPFPQPALVKRDRVR